MQYSLRWILAATAYVALAAAALSQGSWLLADMLWVVSLLASVYAAVLVCYARGKRQAKAIGFVFAGLCFVLSLHFGGAYAVPTPRLLHAVGVSEPVQLITPQYASPPSTIPMSGSSGYTISSGFVAPALVPPAPMPVDYFPVYVRAANAVSVMVFGLMGCALGALAFRAAWAKDPSR